MTKFVAYFRVSTVR
jgi:DNA invertase Pin-like site-specific DNA recombinase